MRRPASTGFRPAGVSVFRGSSSIVHSHPGRPPARPPGKTGARQLLTTGLISLSFLNSENPCISDCIPDLTPLVRRGRPDIYRQGYLPTVAIDADPQGDGAASPAT